MRSLQFTVVHLPACSTLSFLFDTDVNTLLENTSALQYGWRNVFFFFYCGLIQSFLSHRSANVNVFTKKHFALMRFFVSFTKNEHDGREIRDNPFSIQRSTPTVLFAFFYTVIAKLAPRGCHVFPLRTGLMIHDLE